MKDYVRLYTLLLVTNVEPLYNAHTTYLSKQGSVGCSGSRAHKTWARAQLLKDFSLKAGYNQFY